MILSLVNIRAARTRANNWSMSIFCRNRISDLFKLQPSEEHAWHSTAQADNNGIQIIERRQFLSYLILCDGV